MAVHHDQDRRSYITLRISAIRAEIKILQDDRVAARAELLEIDDRQSEAFRAVKRRLRYASGRLLEARADLQALRDEKENTAVRTIANTSLHL